MQVLSFTVIKKIDSALQPFVSFPSAVKFKKANVVFAPSFTIYPLIKVNIASLAKKLAIKNFYKKIDKVHIFTKQKNINKLYVDSNNGLFLSPGIVLRFINLDKSRFLKKRLRTWYGYIKALQLLQRKPFVLFFKDLNGKKTILLNKIRVSGVKVA